MPLAIITGASSGIGREFARQLRRRGVDRFWLIARRRERLEELSRELSCECEIISADLSDTAGIASVKKMLGEKTPSVDYLIMAAGFGDFGAQDELTPDESARVIEVANANLNRTRFKRRIFRDNAPKSLVISAYYFTFLAFLAKNSSS